MVWSGYNEAEIEINSEPSEKGGIISNKTGREDRENKY